MDNGDEMEAAYIKLHEQVTSQICSGLNDIYVATDVQTH
jgi:hypothetical protein